MAGINATGCYFHFISADRTSSRLVLDISETGVDAAVDMVHEYHLSLPHDPDFLNADLRQRDVGGAERRPTE